MNAKQEILESLGKAKRYSMGICFDDAEDEFVRIRKILETHTLEPIDEREFSPAILGWKLTDDIQRSDLRQRRWVSLDEEYKISKTESSAECVGILSERNNGTNRYDKAAEFPWPATQSDGERLLKLLGVLTT